MPPRSCQPEPRRRFGPNRRCICAIRLAATFDAMMLRREPRFGLSDCAWHEVPPHGMPFTLCAAVSSLSDRIGCPADVWRAGTALRLVMVALPPFARGSESPTSRLGA